MYISFFKIQKYLLWYNHQTEKTQYIIESRLKRISEENHWGLMNAFDGLVELKWTSGLRIYTAKINGKLVVILLGGNKNGQKKDINQAKKILKKVRATHFG